jgi:hypothetical protein
MGLGRTEVPGISDFTNHTSLFSDSLLCVRILFVFSLNFNELQTKQKYLRPMNVW